jgi:hypothetical protein
MAKAASAAGRKGACIAFWDGKSPGTAHCIGAAKKAGLIVKIVRF